MKKNSLLFLITFFLFLFGCTTEEELSETVYIEDAENPELPKYTEWGYNTFGAEYENDVFVSKDYIIPLKVIVYQNYTSFQFRGEKGYDDMLMKLNIKGFKPTDYTELDTLHNKKYDLSDTTKATINLSTNYTSYNVDVLEGSKFYFKRVQKLKIDDKQEAVILSGEFNFQTFINGEPVSISNGRFDLTVNNENFFFTNY